MQKPLKVEAQSGFRLHLVYPDGVEGVIDLSSDIGIGVFAPLADEAFFRTVHLGKRGQISWSEDIEICSDAAYKELVPIIYPLSMPEVSRFYELDRQTFGSLSVSTF